jgi:hypothetical protein
LLQWCLHREVAASYRAALERLSGPPAAGGTGTGNPLLARESLVLYQRAVGYSYDAVKIFMPAGAKKPIYAHYVEHVPPDPTSMIFWLKNRDPARWRDA